MFNQVLDLYFKKTPHTDLAKKSVILGVITSIFLIITKLMAWWVTNSVSMLASINDSILDALASFLAYHALIFSATTFDKEHNFGHEKVEGIMALFQCLLVFYSGIMIFREAYEIFLDPKPIENTGIGIIAMIISCFAVYQLIYFQRYVALKTDSILVKGDSLHYLSDFFMNICVILSLALARFFTYIDVLCGVGVGCYVLYNAFLIVKNALNDLMDEALPIKMQDNIAKVIKSIDGVTGIKILRTRSAGMKKYIESIITVDKKKSFIDTVNITQQVEYELKKMFEKVDVFVKVEPS